ncbi:MAG: hypothetical protein SNH01_04370 [Rikenellaceae bacterium]
MEDLLIILSIPLFVIFAVVYAIIRLVSFLKQQAQQGVGGEYVEEYREELDNDLDDLSTQRQRVDTVSQNQEFVTPAVKQHSSTFVQTSPVAKSNHDYDYERQSAEQVGDDGFDVEDFDLRQAVIMSEILQPKFKDEE